MSEKQYVCYFRVFREGKRWIARTTSKDFVNWTAPVDLELGGKPREHLYTNQLAPYPRAPHIYLGLPTRYLPGRRGITDEEAKRIGTPTKWNYANDCTDILLASARVVAIFNEPLWKHSSVREQICKTGLPARNYAARGIVQTGPPNYLSISNITPVIPQIM